MSFFILYFIYFLMLFWFWFWFWFDGSVGGARICGVTMCWWWRGGYWGDCVLNCFGFICCGWC